MSIQPTKPEIQGRRNELFKEGLAVLGWEGEPIRRNENGCKGSAGCMYGCQSGAKVSTDRCVERAVGDGAVVYTSITIERLVMDGDRVRGVEGTVRHPTTHERTHGAKFLARDCVVLAAGVMATPQIMQRSGLKHKGIGANLRIHPSLYMLGKFEETVTPWQGATQGWHCTEFLKSGIKLESMWADAGVLSEKFPSNPEKFQHYLKDVRSICGMGRLGERRRFCWQSDRDAWRPRRLSVHAWRRRCPAAAGGEREARGVVPRRRRQRSVQRYPRRTRGDSLQTRHQAHSHRPLRRHRPAVGLEPCIWHLRHGVATPRSTSRTHSARSTSRRTSSSAIRACSRAPRA